MKPVEVVPRRREGGNMGRMEGESEIYCKCICKCHNVTPHTTIM
jgi:hypothetical protein